MVVVTFINVVLRYGFNTGLIWGLELVSFLFAWLVLLLLSISSPMFIRRKLGKRWQPLHNLIYVTVPIVILHFYWSLKSGWIEPAIYLIITIALLSVRRPKLKRILLRKRAFNL